jgi:hypothetical protein
VSGGVTAWLDARPRPPRVAWWFPAAIVAAFAVAFAIAYARLGAERPAPAPASTRLEPSLVAPLPAAGLQPVARLPALRERIVARTAPVRAAPRTAPPAATAMPAASATAAPTAAPPQPLAPAPAPAPPRRRQPATPNVGQEFDSSG